MNYTDCDRALNTGAAISFFADSDVDVVIAAPCSGGKIRLSSVNSTKLLGAQPLGRLATYYNRTVLAWGYVTDYEFTLESEYPYLTTIMQNTYS